MTIHRHIRHTLAATAVALLAACSDEPAQDTFVYTDVVILAANDDTSGSTYLLDNTTLISPDVTLDAAQFPIGDCMLLRYTITGGDDPVIISPLAAAHINNLTVTEAEAAPATGDSEPVSLITAWFNRTHLIMRCMLPYDPTPRTIGVTAVRRDSDGTVDIYLIHHRDEQTVTFSREYYVAADLTPLAADAPVPVILHLPGAGSTTSLTLPPL